MEYVGEEKKIQELFRELRLESERVTPRFTTMWARAQAGPARPLRAFNLSFALATALLVCALVSLALWSRHVDRTRVTIATPPSNAGAPPATPSLKSKEEQAIVFSPQIATLKKRRANKVVIHQEAVAEVALTKYEITSVKAISNWESPTASLLRSPSEQVLTTVPQFNDAVKDMKSFLPSTDKPKEK
jgi:hypothetical protein